MKRSATAHRSIGDRTENERTRQFFDRHTLIQRLGVESELRGERETFQRRVEAIEARARCPRQVDQATQEKRCCRWKILSFRQSGQETANLTVSELGHPWPALLRISLLQFTTQLGIFA